MIRTWNQRHDAAPERCPAGRLYLLCLGSASWCLREQRPPSDPQLHQNTGTVPDPQDCHSPQTVPICGHLQRKARYEFKSNHNSWLWHPTYRGIILTSVYRLHNYIHIHIFLMDYLGNTVYRCIFILFFYCWHIDNPSNLCNATTTPCEF